MPGTSGPPPAVPRASRPPCAFPLLATGIRRLSGGRHDVVRTKTVCAPSPRGSVSAAASIPRLRPARASRSGAAAPASHRAAPSATRSSIPRSRSHAAWLEVPTASPARRAAALDHLERHVDRDVAGSGRGEGTAGAPVIRVGAEPATVTRRELEPGRGVVDQPQRAAPHTVRGRDDPLGGAASGPGGGRPRPRRAHRSTPARRARPAPGSRRGPHRRDRRAPRTTRRAPGPRSRREGCRAARSRARHRRPDAPEARRAH